MAAKSERKNEENTLFLMCLFYHNTKKGATVAFFVNCYFQKLLPAIGTHSILQQTYPACNWKILFSSFGK